jgi:GNAT superfamily N-acetyltransferase
MTPDACTRWLSATGMKAVFRLARADDRQALKRAFSRLTPDEIRLRFLHPIKALPAQFLRELGSNPNELLIVVEARYAKRLEIVATARCVLSADQAEFALVVPHALTSQGLGLLLLERLKSRCRERGVRQLVGDVSHENSAMLSLARKCGFRIERHEDPGLIRVVYDL